MWMSFTSIKDPTGPPDQVKQNSFSVQRHYDFIANLMLVQLIGLIGLFSKIHQYLGAEAWPRGKQAERSHWDSRKVFTLQYTYSYAQKEGNERRSIAMVIPPVALNALKGQHPGGPSPNAAYTNYLIWPMTDEQRKEKKFSVCYKQSAHLIVITNDPAFSWMHPGGHDPNTAITWFVQYLSSTS